MVRRRANGNPIRLLVQISADLEKGGFFFVMLRAYFLLKQLSSNAFSPWISMLHRPLLSCQRWMKSTFTHFYDRTMFCRLCRLHEATLSPTCAGTQAIKIQQLRTGRARRGSRDHRKKFQDFEEISEQTGLLDLEILFIRELELKLYKRSDSVGAKLFT